MYVQRQYDDQGNVTHLKLLRTPPADQKIPEQLVGMGFREGWLSIESGRFIFKSEPPLVLRIVEEPGYYCCHSGVQLPGEVEAQQHVAANYANVPSPDPQNPAGYRRTHYYACQKEG